MKTVFKIRVATKEEYDYAYTQSSQIMEQTRCIGHLKAEIDYHEGFFSTWDNHCAHLKTDSFKSEFDELINRFRWGRGEEKGYRHEDEDCFLTDCSTLSRYCWSHPSANMGADSDNYCFRVDSDEYTYIMRLNPHTGIYNLYCYCYCKDWLDKYLQNTK